MDGPLALHEALSSPMLDCLLPVAGTPAWAAARDALDPVLAEHCVPRRIRSPGALWQLRRGGPSYCLAANSFWENGGPAAHRPRKARRWRFAILQEL